MPRIYSGDPDREFQRLRREGRAGLPRDPLRFAADRREMMNTARFGSLVDDVANLEGQMSRGRQLLEGRGFRDFSQKNLATAGPENIEAIGDMRRRRTANTISGGGMGNSQVAWPKFRDPFEAFREKAWWFLKEGEFSQSLKKVREWCNTPDAPIWMADGTFKPIGEINVGEEVMGWEWIQTEGGQWRKHLKPSRVLATNLREAPMVVEVELESGRTMRCTPDHKWANANYSPAMWGGEGEEPRKGRTLEYREAEVGMTLNNFVDPVEPLTEKKQIEAAAYLGGIIDGEGSVAGSEIRIGQSMEKNPEICERIEQSMNILGLNYRIQDRDGVGHFGSGIRIWSITGGRRELAKMRSWIPSVKVEKAWENARSGKSYGTRDKVTSITELGSGEVVSMETETGNYVAWGVASKNCRLMYMTHPLVPSLIDIYARFPLLDIEFKHQDKKLADFYNDLFLNELNYQDFLYDMSKEFWTCGEAFALGSWHEGIGAWDDDELINPDDVIVSRNSVLRQYQFHLKVPEGIKKLIETRQPRQEYEMLVKFYPYILQWAQQNREIPVSDVLMKQLKFKVNPWEPHGVPMLMRGFKVLMLEMSLEAAQDAVADRLYSPLILAKLGIEDLSDMEGPWIPEPEELDALRDDLSLALMSDFRLMVYHHGLQIESVFGRENMPRLDYDFDRIDRKLMQIFGIGPELLQGGNSGAPYASGALNRELITQMLSTYQSNIKRFIQSRAAVVAERQGHFEFEKRGGQRYPIYETALMLDEETGEEYIEERPKLAIPEVSFRTMNLRDEMTERQFLMSLRQSGIPISDESLMMNIPFEFEEEVLKLEREKADKVIAELNYQKRLFTSMYLNRLPIPPEYYQAYIQFLSGIQGVALASNGTDITSASPTPNLFPMMQPTQGDINNAMMVEQMAAEEMLEMPMYRPEISDEQRGGEPKKSSLRMYASKEEVDESNRIGFDAFVEKLGSISSDVEPESSTEILDFEDEEPLPWHQEKPVVESLEEANSRKVDGIKSMASPGHMRLRRKMTLPSGIRYSQANDVEEEMPSGDSERPVEEPSSVPDGGDESAE